MNYYSYVIDICCTEQDWKSIAINVAKKHPKIFLDAAGIIDWRAVARDLYINQGEKIKAIKHCRNITGMGLKEAKEAVEALES